MTNLEDLIAKVLEFRNERDWKQFHNPKDLAVSLSLEAAEVLEHFQWKNKEEMAEHVTTHREELGEELSDVLFWVLLMAHDMEIDIATAFVKKLGKNAAKYPVEKSKGKHTKYTEL